MQATREETVNITLILNKTEAEWLRDAMQNPLHGKTIHDETKEDAFMRVSFFQTLKTYLKDR